MIDLNSPSFIVGCLVGDQNKEDKVAAEKLNNYFVRGEITLSQKIITGRLTFAFPAVVGFELLKTNVFRREAHYFVEFGYLDSNNRKSEWWTPPILLRVINLSVDFGPIIECSIECVSDYWFDSSVSVVDRMLLDDIKNKNKKSIVDVLDYFVNNGYIDQYVITDDAKQIITKDIGDVIISEPCNLQNVLRSLVSHLSSKYKSYITWFVVPSDGEKMSGAEINRSNIMIVLTGIPMISQALKRKYYFAYNKPCDIRSRVIPASFTVDAPLSLLGSFGFLFSTRIASDTKQVEKKQVEIPQIDLAKEKSSSSKSGLGIVLPGGQEDQEQVLDERKIQALKEQYEMEFRLGFMVPTIYPGQEIEVQNLGGIDLYEGEYYIDSVMHSFGESYGTSGKLYRPVVFFK